jgi:hypothetical protein
MGGFSRIWGRIGELMRSRYPDIDKAKMIDAFCGDNSMIEFENI